MILTDPKKLRLVYYPDPILKKKCAPVEDFGEDLTALAAQMLEFMHEAKGLGLAAIQVGVLRRLFVCNATGEPGGDLTFVNPAFIELTGVAEQEEGCLCLPGAGVTMRRATRVVIEAQTTEGKPFQRTGEGLLARVWQHEVDHLEGRLISDNMSPADEIANRRALKQLREDFNRARHK